MTGTRLRRGTVDVSALLRRWTDRGLVSTDQAERILRSEGLAGPVVPSQRTAEKPSRPAAGAPGSRLLVEALAYLGGVLALAAALLLLQLTWSDLSTAARLAVPTIAAAALLLGGALLPRGADELARLRSVLWLLATGAWLGALAVLGDQVLEADGRDTVLIMGLGGSALALRLYLVSRTPPQQLARSCRWCSSPRAGRACHLGARHGPRPGRLARRLRSGSPSPNGASAPTLVGPLPGGGRPGRRRGHDAELAGGQAVALGTCRLPVRLGRAA